MEPLGDGEFNVINVLALNTSGNSPSSPESIVDDSMDNFSLDLENSMEDLQGEELQEQSPSADEVIDIEIEGQEGNEERHEDNQGEVAPAALVLVDMQEAKNEGHMLRFGTSGSDPHPLLVPNIIQDILKHLPLSEVMKCRTVCHRWNEESCRIIQKSKTITFRNNSGITSYMKYYPAPVEGGSLSRPIHSTYQMYKVDFCETNSELQHFFYAHGSHIQTLILQQKHPVTERELYLALENHLPNLETLWLRYIPIPLRRPSARLYKEKQHLPLLTTEHSFPTIKHLTVGTQSFMTAGEEREDINAVVVPVIPVVMIEPNGDENGGGGGGDGGNANGNGDGNPELPEDDNIHVLPHRGDEATVRASLVRLLSSLPNLQTLSCSFLDNWCDFSISRGILRALVQVPRDKVKNLGKLNFPLHVTQTILEGLNAQSLSKLSELNIHFGKSVEVPAARQLLQTVAPSLQTLSLSLPADYSYSRVIRLPAQEMRRLKHLRLSRYRWPLDFLEKLTTLETLICVDMPIPTTFPIRIKRHNLRTFKIQGRDHPITDSEVVSRITRAFPRLRVLHIPGVNDDCLRVIYTDLPYLTDLACTAGEFTDCGISGVPLEVCNDLAETTTYSLVNPDKFRRDLFIGNLTNLTRLRLESPSMSHLSVLFGIAKCTRVEYLHLKSDKIHDAAIDSIADKMILSLKILNLINCPLVTEAGKFFARERIPNLEVYVNGDIIEDSEHMERVKLQIKHVQFDGFSRRRARDRQDILLDLQRRRMALRMLREQNHEGPPQAREERLAAAVAAAAGIIAGGPLPPLPPAPDLDRLFDFDMQLHDFHDLNSNNANQPGDVLGALIQEELLGLGNFYDDDEDDVESSTDDEGEMPDLNE